MPIAFGGLGALVYYAKRGVEVLSRSDPAPDTAVLRSKLQKRLIAAKERVQDGFSVPLKLRWLRDYAMIQAGAGLKLGLSYSWFTIPMTIIFMRGTPGAERVLIRNCVRNAGLLGAFSMFGASQWVLNSPS